MSAACRASLELRIEGRPVPWKAPTFGQSWGGGAIARRDPAYEAWHQSIAIQSRVQCAGFAPIAVPCRLEATFRLRRVSGAAPDLANLTKALEDGLQGSAIENDRLICAHDTRRVFVGATEWEGVEAILIPVGTAELEALAPSLRLVSPAPKPKSAPASASKPKASRPRRSGPKISRVSSIT